MGLILDDPDSTIKLAKHYWSTIGNKMISGLNYIVLIHMAVILHKYIQYSTYTSNFSHREHACSKSSDRYKTCSSGTIEKTVDIDKINHSSTFLKRNFDKICQLNDTKKKKKILSKRYFYLLRKYEFSNKDKSTEQNSGIPYTFAFSLFQVLGQKPMNTINCHFPPFSTSHIKLLYQSMKIQYHVNETDLRNCQIMVILASFHKIKSKENNNNYHKGIQILKSILQALISTLPHLLLFPQYSRHTHHSHRPFTRIQPARTRTRLRIGDWTRTRARNGTLTLPRPTSPALPELSQKRVDISLPTHY
ncbi:hypothetical protein G4B88_014017 [Cannabis sativa]|uniref:Uncharacterized protein n=1 Tax=Cannabis sativa TaxID=3483 RepID=A0A7J6I1B6_CANSA|nr:hypothetical protein G4B88_014017 [Cannabis sativa]